jgi:hypothetical protein
MDIQKMPTLAEKQGFWAEQLPNFEATYWLPSHFEFVAFDMNQGNYVIKGGLSPDFEEDATEIYHRINTGWAMWRKALNFSRKQAQTMPKGFVLVPKAGAQYFSHDFNGDGFKYHDTLEEAKKEAEANLDWYRDQVADGRHVNDMGEFNELCYGLVIGSAEYSIDHVVTQGDIDKGEYLYEVGTEILSLYLNEAQEQSHD